MEDFYYAGGLPTCSRPLANRCNKDAITANGKRSGRTCRTPRFDESVIRTLDNPFMANAGITIPARQSRAERRRDQTKRRDGQTAAHRGKAVVFETIEELHERINDESLDIDENSVMVLKNCGPKGYPGMAEGGQHAAAAEVLRKGHQRHGARERRPHERHRVRHRRTARRTEAAAGAPRLRSNRRLGHPSTRQAAEA